MVSGIRDNPPPRVTRCEFTFPCVVGKFKQLFINMNDPELSREARKLEGTSCLTGRVVSRRQVG